MRKSKIFIFFLMLTILCSCSKNETSQKISDTETSDISDNTETATKYESESVVHSEEETIVQTTTQKAESENKIEKEEKEIVSDTSTSSDMQSFDGGIQAVSYDSVNDKDVNRPAVLKGTEVFIGWEENDENNVLSQFSDEDETALLTAETEDISEVENAIFNDTIYAKANAEYVDVPIIIGGETDFSVLDLEMSFDTELFSFDSFVNTDGDVLGNCIGDGKIAVSFVSTSNIKGNVDLCTVRLKKNISQATDTRLVYNVKDIAKWNDDLTDYVNVTYKIINDKIVIY